MNDTDRKKGGRETLTPATSNGTAASIVRVSLCSRLTVIVWCTPLWAWHGVPLQSSIANVLRGLQYAPVDLGVHFKLILSHASGHWALAARLVWTPAQMVLATCVNGRQGDESHKDQWNRQEKTRGISHVVDVLFWLSFIFLLSNCLSWDKKREGAATCF